MRRRLSPWVMFVLVASACASVPRRDVPGAQRALARELVHRRDWQHAFAVVDGLCRSSPDDAEALMLRGVIYREQKLYAESEADLKEAIRIRTDVASAHSALGILYDTLRRSDDALEQHKRASELEPRDPGYLNNLGFSLFGHGRPREAIPVFHEALRSAPTDPRIRNNLGFAYAAAGDLSRATEQFAMAGTASQAKNNLGFAYERRGALPQAYDAYAEALRLDPTASVARDNLTRVARALGREPPVSPSPVSGG